MVFDTGRLHDAAEHAAEGRRDQAAAVLDGILNAAHGDMEARDGLTARIFAAALARRIGHQLPATANLYLRDLDVAQISLFNLLATRLPPVQLAGRLSNEIVAGFIADRDKPVLFDIGIGTGQQEVSLLRDLSRRGRLPQRLHVVALEPSRTSLEEAERNLAAVADEVKLELTVTPVPGLVEHLGDAEWADLARLGHGAVVNAAFAMHHVQSTGAGPAAARDDVFRRVRALEPVAFVLAEPNGDHLEPDFLARVDNCLWHFGTLFGLIDKLDLDHRERAAMKLFFAREIDDIIANNEATRAERHEWTTTWLSRLEETGFTPVTQLPFESSSLDVGFRAEPNEGHVALCVGADTIVSVICAVTSGATLDAAGWVETRPATADARAEPVRTSVSTSASAAMRVGAVMSAPPATLALGARLDEAARLVAATGASDVMVVDDTGKLIGVLSEDDVIRSLMPGAGELDVASPVELFELLSINGRVRGCETIDPLVIRDPIVLNPDDDLLRAAETMVSRQIRRLPVVDGGRLVGTISRADVCFALLAS